MTNRQIVNEDRKGQEQGHAMVFPGPLAEKEHPEDDQTELGGQAPAVARCGGSPAGPDHQGGEDRHATLDQIPRLGPVQGEEVMIVQGGILVLDVC